MAATALVRSSFAAERDALALTFEKNASVFAKATPDKSDALTNERISQCLNTRHGASASSASGRRGLIVL